MIYTQRLEHCPCGKPATHAIMMSGTDQRGVACQRHAERDAKALAALLGTEYAP